MNVIYQFVKESQSMHTLYLIDLFGVLLLVVLQTQHKMHNVKSQWKSWLNS